MNISKVIASVFIVCCLLPYTPPILSTDSQPIALVISLLLIPSYIRKYLLRKEFVLFFFVFMFAVGEILISRFDFNAFRSLTNYLSLFCISYVTYNVLNSYKGLNYKLFKKIVYFWFIVGFVQTFFYPKFLSFLSPRGSAFYYGRGVSCLAPEPTFYAIICICMLIISYLNSCKKEINWLLWIQIIFFARSTTVIFISVSAFLLYLLLRNGFGNFLYACIICGLLCVGIKFLVPYLDSFRVGILLASLIDNPTKFLISDESVNERFIHAFFPIYGSFINFGIPYGFGKFNDFMRDIYNQGNFHDLLLFYREDYTRIMSGFGSAMFELGLIGYLVPYVIVKNVYKLAKNDRRFIFYGILFIFIMLNAMPLSNATIGFTIGNIVYASNQIQYQHKKFRNYNFRKTSL